MLLKPGYVLLDKYRIERSLGSGGWGDVYLAADLQLGRQVAIKHLKADWAKDEMILKRFLQEARTIAALKQPANVVIIHTLEQDGDEHYIVEEYAEKGTVSDLLEKHTRLSVDQVMDIAVAICRALEVVHPKGIVHRDIKPNNILLCENPDGELVPKLCDFGIAHVPSAGDKRPLTSEGDILGTVQYMSPEQIKGEVVDERSDIYSLGAVLYEMVTGQHVFTGSVYDIWQAHVSKEPCPPILERPEIPSALNDLIMRALSKDPADRYQKARDMSGALEQMRPQEVEKHEEVKSLHAQGMAHLRAGEWRRAARLFAKIVTLDPDHREAAAGLEEAKMGLYVEGRECLQRRHWQGAIERFLALVRLDVGYKDAVDRLEEARMQYDLEILYTEGISYFNKKQWPSAAAKLREVLSLQKGYADAGVKLEEAERQQKLENLYEQAVRQCEQRDWAAAVKTFTEIVGLRTDYRDVQARLEEAEKQQRLESLYQHGLEHSDREEWPAAAQAFRQVLEVDEHFQNAATKLSQAEQQQRLSESYNRGLRFEKLEEWEEAYKLFHHILTVVPAGYRDVADRLARTGRLSSLARLCKEADELWAAGRWQEAVDRFRQAADLDRQHRDLDRRARRELDSKLRVARRDLKWLEEAYNKGLVSLEAQNWARAAEAFRQVLELNPNHQDAAARLKEVEERSAQPAVGVKSIPSQHQPTEKLFDSKRIAQRALIGMVLSAIIAVLIGTYLIPSSLPQLILLGIGILAILFALSIAYDIFRMSIK